MNCEQIRRNLPLYCYYELNREEVLQVKLHLRTCQHCRDELYTLQKTLRFIDERGKIILPLSYRRILLSKMRGTLPLEEKTVLVRKPVLVFATVVTVITLVLSIILTRNMHPLYLNWEDHTFTYKAEELETDIYELNLSISAKTQKSSVFSFENELESILQEIEELKDFFSI